MKHHTPARPLAHTFTSVVTVASGRQTPICLSYFRYRSPLPLSAPQVEFRCWIWLIDRSCVVTAAAHKHNTPDQTAPRMPWFVARSKHSPTLLKFLTHTRVSPCLMLVRLVCTLAPRCTTLHHIAPQVLSLGAILPKQRGL